MEIKKVKETYVLTDREKESKVQLEVNFPAESFEVLRMKVETGSLIVEEAEKLAVELLNKKP